MPTLGPTELLIILLIIIVLFGASRLAGIGGALGNSIREFRKSVREDDTPTAPQPSTRDGERGDATRSERV